MALSADTILEFLDAAEAGKRNIVSAKVKDVGVNVRGRNGRTALALAAINGRRPVAEFLLEQDQIDVNIGDNDGRTVLHYACQYGRQEIIQLLADNEELEWNLEDNDGKTPMFLALENSRIDVARDLLKIDDVKVDVTSDQQTMAMLACASGEVDIVESMKAKNPDAFDIDVKDKDGKSCLTYACEFGFSEVGKVVLEGKDINALWFEYATAGDGNVVQFLLDEYNLDVNEEDADERTALILASKKGNKNILDILFDHDKSVDLMQCTRVNHQDKDGKSALMFACEEGHEEIVKELLGRKDIVVQPECAGLLIANDMMDMLVMLIRVADVNLKDSRGFTALIYAAKNGRIACAKLLLNEEDTDVNAQCELGYTALHYACEIGSVGTVKCLLEHKDMKVNVLSEEGESAFHIAAAKGYPSVARILLDQDEIDANLATKHGFTGLMLACKEGRTDVAKMLLDEGVAVNNRSTDGRSELVWACIGRRTEIIEALMQKPEIDLTIESKEEETAEKIAREEEDIMKLLKREN